MTGFGWHSHAQYANAMNMRQIIEKSLSSYILPSSIPSNVHLKNITLKTKKM